MKNEKPRSKSSSQIHLRYIRLPNRVLDLYDELIYRSRGTIVGRSKITSTHSVVFDGEVVLAPGFEMVYFELRRRWFTIGKVRDQKGRHTGYYCDIVSPPRFLKESEVEVTDLFLDLWVSPDLRYKILDEDESEEAFVKGWITKRLYGKAKEQLTRLIECVKRGEFPPDRVKYLERKLGL